MEESEKNNSRWVPAKQAADLLEVHYLTFLGYLRDGIIPGAKKVGRDWRISRQRYLQWLHGDEGNFVAGLAMFEVMKR